MVIDAWEFTREELKQNDSWVREKREYLYLVSQYGEEVLYIEIDTLEGKMRADLSDFIIKGVNGELYPCKPDIFYKTYEEDENKNTISILKPIVKKMDMKEKKK